MILQSLRWLVLGWLVAVSAARGEDGWLVHPHGEELRIFRTRPDQLPMQVAALHTSSAYFRLAPGMHSGWGTSVVLSPTLWSDGKLHQGAAVDAQWEPFGEALRLHVRGGIHTVMFGSDLLLSPPDEAGMRVDVRGWTEGQANLPENNPEAFKPVFLSSMRISDDDWDASSAEAGDQRASLPRQGFVFDQYVPARTFGLRGGSSRWKRGAPSVWIEMDQPLEVQGWVTESLDPNDDNVGMWAGSKSMMSSWSYRLLAVLENAEAPVEPEPTVP